MLNLLPRTAIFIIKKCFEIRAVLSFEGYTFCAVLKIFCSHFLCSYKDWREQRKHAAIFVASKFNAAENG